jgi:hypothetical protein
MGHVVDMGIGVSECPSSIAADSSFCCSENFPWSNRGRSSCLQVARNQCLAHMNRSSLVLVPGIDFAVDFVVFIIFLERLFEQNSNQELSVPTLN